MTAYLLDVNLVVALSWPGHQFHETVQRWFAHHAPKGWATCPIVEAGFVRIVSNPAFSPRAVSPSEAVSALRGTVNHPAHQFWPDSIAFADAVRFLRGPLTGHRQITDAYLVGLAIHKKGKLATLDRGMLQIAPPGAVELVS